MKEKAYGCLLGNLIESRIAWHPVRGLCYWLAGLASIRSVKPIGQRGCVAEGQVTRRGGESRPVAGGSGASTGEDFLSVVYQLPDVIRREGRSKQSHVFLTLVP